MRTFDFSGKNVLVTGASSGIGMAVADSFAAANAELTILADRDEVHKTGDMLSTKHGRKINALQCDITDRELVSRVLESFSQIDVLINNAGLEFITPILQKGEEVEEIFRRITDINIMGTYYVTRDAIKVMPEGSSIIITASIWSKTAVAGFGAYCASKHANLGFMRSLAQELGPKDITVNAICPGLTRTIPAMRSIKEEAERSNRTEQQVLDELLEVQALPGVMEPEDLASSYLFLASEYARNISGQSLHVDRGAFMD